MLIAILVLILIVSLFLNYKRIKKRNVHKKENEKINIIPEIDRKPENKDNYPRIIGTPKSVDLFSMDMNSQYAKDAYSFGKNDMIDKLARERLGLSNDDVINLELLDPLFEESARLVVESQIASTSAIQRRFSIGYNRAGRIIDQLESRGIAGAFNGTKEREVLIRSDDDLEKILKYINSDFVDHSLIFKEGELGQFIFENKDAIDAKVEFYLRIKEQKEEVEKDRQRQLIEAEKERIKQEILEKKRKKELRKIALQELQEEGILENTKKREAIPQEIQDIVWNRDGGKCVKCGSQENLEFDHIIPFSKGGSNTARNLQLLCEKCNREKSNSIG